MDFNSLSHEQISRYSQLINNPSFSGIPQQYANYNATSRLSTGGSVASPPTSTSDQEDNSDTESTSASGSSKKRQRGNYKCRKCGQPKKGHSCPFFSAESSSPPDPSTPDTENSGGGPVVPPSAPITSSAQNLLGASLEDQQLLQRIRELEHENYLIQHENSQLRERLMGLGYGTAIQQIQSYVHSTSMYAARPQAHNVGMSVGGIPVSYSDSAEWDYAMKKRRLHESGEGY